MSDPQNSKAEAEAKAEPAAPNSDDASGPARTSGGGETSSVVMGIPVTVQVVLGSAVMPVARIMKLGRGGVIPLDRQVGEPVDVVVNGHTVARGEIVGTQNDTRFGVSLTEIIGRTEIEEGE